MGFRVPMFVPYLVEDAGLISVHIAPDKDSAVIMHMYHFQITMITQKAIVREITQEEFKTYRKYVCYRDSCNTLCEKDICNKYGGGLDFKWNDNLVEMNEIGFECYVPNK